MGRPRIPLAERFWTKIQRTDSCWEWTGATDRNGYGVISVPTQNKRYQVFRKTHRVAWELAYGAVTGELCVLHHCDNPKCVRPTHLFLGTHSDNAHDKYAKGRQAKGMQRSSLTDVDVCTIRAKYATGGISQQALAVQYNIGREAIGKIVRRDNWKHLP